MKLKIQVIHKIQKKKIFGFNFNKIVKIFKKIIKNFVYNMKFGIINRIIKNKMNKKYNNLLIKINFLYNFFKNKLNKFKIKKYN